MAGDDSALIGILTHLLAAGKANASQVLPALEELARPQFESSTISDLLDSLERREGHVFAELARHLHQCRLREARRYYTFRKGSGASTDQFQLLLGDLPLDASMDWETKQALIDSLQSLQSLARDRRFALSKSDVAPVTAAHIGQTYQTRLERAFDLPDSQASEMLRWLVEAFESRLTDQEGALASALRSVRTTIESSTGEQAGDSPAALAGRYRQTESTAEKKRLFDRLCSSQDMSAAQILKELIETSWEKQRAALILTCRFGKPSLEGWTGWSNWLERCERQRLQEMEKLRQVVTNNPAELLLAWYSRRPDADADVVRQIDQWCINNSEHVAPEPFVERWADHVPAEEWNALLGIEIIVDEPAPQDPSEPTGEVAVVGAPASDATREADESEPDHASVRPSFWNTHLQPFLAEQWYMVAGVVMVIAGSSLLAYYTWDKHWLVRYTVMPALLAGFTAALARTASWIQRTDEQFAATAAVLRGAAIALLPVNFMAVALLSDDAQVSHKVIAVPVMCGIYLLVFGYGLKRWSEAVHPPIAWLLGGTLLVLNSLVMLAPLATTVARLSSNALWICVGAGFHVGFLVMGAATLRFCNRVMTPELAEQRHVPWFFGTTLLVTFVQVFAWVHGFLGHLPDASSYGPMVILAGGLVLVVERRAQQLLNRGLHVGESFIGFALILLGVLMGAQEPSVRILCFLLAGVVWLRQTMWRASPLHEWIGLTLLALAGASVGLLDAFPKPWLPGLGLATACLVGAGGILADRMGNKSMSTSCAGMHAAVLLITTTVAVLAQWRYQTAPLYTGGWLLLIAALFAYQAWRHDQLRWVHTAMAILGVSLMYLGCVDMVGRTLHGNTMVFGLSILSILWLLLNACTSARLVRDARSTVLWIYGAVAVAAMVLRVIMERGMPGDALWYRQFMDYFGPLLMAASLVFATWYSRSLIPAGMAAVIVIILFPELRANFQESFDSLGWGTGLGSSFSALWLMILCFPLQRSTYLKELGDGDRFMGRFLFPVRRYDHSLFTLPILASVLYLAVKTDTLTLARHWIGGGVGLKTSIAVAATAVTWTLLAVYNHRHEFAKAATYVGCLYLFVGVWFVHSNLVDDLHWTGPVLTTGLLFQAFYLGYLALQSRWGWIGHVLTEPTRLVLESSTLVTSAVCLIQLTIGREWLPLAPLMVFLGGQLIWHALATRRSVHGAVLFAMNWIWLLAYSAPGPGRLLERISVAASMTPTLWLLLGVHALLVITEFKEEVGRFLRPLGLPFLVIATVISTTSLLFAVGDMLYDGQFTVTQQLMLIAAGLLTARVHTSNALLLPVLLLSYLAAYRTDLLEIVGNPWDVLVQRCEFLSHPLRTACLGVGLASLGHVGRVIYDRKRFIVSGRFGLLFLKSTHVAWLFVPASMLAISAATLHGVVDSYRGDPAQLWVPYLAAVTMALVGQSWWRLPCYYAGVLLLTVGNIHCVRYFGGAYLQQQGLSDIHLLCLGILATLLQGTVARLAARRDLVSLFVNQTSLALAGLILSLLAANYFTHPNLAEIPWLRFVASGSMAYAAGCYFRRAARRPGPGEEAYVDVCEGLYHAGLTVAIWCAVLLLPWMRQPAIALCALGVPIAYFYARAEIDRRVGLDSGRLYRNSAAALSFAVCFFYVFRFAFQMLLFPDEPVIETDYYHYNAPFIVVLSLLMLRLHGLGGTSWLALYGGLALVAGTYFTATWPNKLSPFAEPVRAAWIAVALGHFWTLVTNQRSPIRTGIQRWAVIDGQHWFELRRVLGVWLLLSVQVCAIWGMLGASDAKMIAPLLLGAASLWIHHGVLRKSAVYFALGGLQILLALHADFFIDSYLPKDYVVWVLLGLWALGLAADLLLTNRLDRGAAGILAAVAASLVMVHVLYHHPCSTKGLWAAAAVGVLGALTPRATQQARTDEQQVLAGLLLLVPVWLAYFSQADLITEGWRAASEDWPVLCTVAAVFLTGSLASMFQISWARHYDQLSRMHPRLFDQTLSLMSTHGNAINSATLYFSFAATVVVQISHYNTPYETRSLVLIAGLYAAYVAGWYFEGSRRRTMPPYIVLQLCVLGFFAVFRRQLMLTTDFWSPEYDVWASLVVSFGLTGCKQVFDLQHDSVRIPLLGTLLALPVVALIWVLYNHLGTDVALMIVGLHSLMFSFMGKDDRESPYNVVALAGFVAFVLISFWSKLELRVIHAYTLPVGVGVLVLLQMFRRHIEPETRYRVRLVTLLVMIGSTGFYALVDDRYPLTFNLLLIAVCLSSMALGSFFRIRLYLALGFAGLMVDVGSLVFKVFRGMERSSRMTLVGGTVLLIGVALVVGALYYKTHRPLINQKLNRLRTKAGEWE